MDDLKDRLGDRKDEVVRMGVTIGKDGEVSFFAELEKSGERQKEFIDRIRENKKAAAEKSEADSADPRHRYERGYEKSKRTTVYASSADELLDKISHVDWDDIKEDSEPYRSGERFSTSI